MARLSRALPIYERCERPRTAPLRACGVQPGRLAHGPDEKCGTFGRTAGFAMVIDLSFQIGAPRWGGVSRGRTYGSGGGTSSRIMDDTRRTIDDGRETLVVSYPSSVVRRPLSVVGLQNLKPAPTRPVASVYTRPGGALNASHSNSARRKMFGVSAQSTPPPTARPYKICALAL